MKKSYIKLIIFSFVVILLLLLNAFAFKILNKLYLSIFILILLIVFKFLFGFEKDRHRYTKEVIFQIIIYLLTFFIIYYSLGLLIGFARTENYLTWYGVSQIILPLIMNLVLKEIFRYMMIIKSSESKKLIVLSTILFIFLDITISLSTSTFNNATDIFMFISLILLPIVSQNIVFTIIVLKYGYKPNIVYLLITNLYVYLIPIIPNPNEYLYSVIEFLLPICMLISVMLHMKKYKDEELDSTYRKHNNYLLIIPMLLVIVLVYFTSGEFKYYSVAIASGSMRPTLNVGDIVIIEKNIDVGDLKEGYILAYNYGNNIIVHRINKIIKANNETLIYTKGDYNKNPDSYKVEYDKVIGVVKTKLPLIGYPTVLISKMKLK